jgi:MinD superfamily P-loop ATPase
VAEPTLFGVHNLNMVYELVKLFEKPFGVVLNKVLDNDNPAREFCLEHNIKILSEIVYDNKLGEITSNGKIAVREDTKYQSLFLDLLKSIKKEIQNETTLNS